MNGETLGSYERRSRETLELALLSVPAYEAWRAADTGGTVDERYAALPALTKADLRRHGWGAFIPEGMDPVSALEDGAISLAATSGTTAERVVNVWNQEWWDRSERLSWRYHRTLSGLRYGEEPEAILTGPLSTGILSDERELSFRERRLGRFLYLNERSTPALWDERFMNRMLDELSSFRPTVLEANPSYLARLALHAVSNGRTVYQPRVIVLTYENPRPLTRRQIREAFYSPLVSSFGSTETGYVLTECEEGRLHQNIESCRIDLVPLPGEAGRAGLSRPLVTTFDNPWRVLVRFDTGDIVRPVEACRCGRDGGLTAARIEGRTDDLTRTAEGRIITPYEVDEALCEVQDLVMYRLEQRGPAEFFVEVETTDGSIKAAREVRDRLAALYGTVERLTVRPVGMIETSPSGKYRQVVACCEPMPELVLLG
jgi:phenylacetate-coenzyme A ligase PaaK-like adenylate-forming protein